MSEPPIPKYLISRGNWRSLGLDSDPRRNAIAAPAFDLLEPRLKEQAAQPRNLVAAIKRAVEADETSALISKSVGDGQALIRAVSAFGDPLLRPRLEADFKLSDEDDGQLGTRVQRGHLTDIGYRLIAAELQAVFCSQLLSGFGHKTDSTSSTSILIGYNLLARSFDKASTPIQNHGGLAR